MADYGYLHRGVVIEIDEADYPYVEITSRAAGRKWGPLPSAVAGLEVGDRVVLGAIGTTADDMCIIARYPGRTEQGDVTGLEPRLDAIDTTLEAHRIDLDTDAAMLDDHDTRLNGHDTAIAAGVTKDNTQDTAISTNATGVANGIVSLAQLRADTAGRVTTKGDLLVATASGVLARKPAPTNGLLWVADSTQPDGWVARDVLGLPKALTGAISPTRYVGATTAGAPTTGTFAVGDFVVDVVTGVCWTCTVAGTPGTWSNPGLSRPLGHTGMTGGFQNNPSPGVYCLFPTAQVLRGGVTHNAAQNALVVGKTGLHRVTAKGYFTGGTAYQGLIYVTRNSTALPPLSADVIANALAWKADAGDFTGFVSELRTLTAGDLIRLYTQGNAATYGSTGYDGSFIEIEYLDQ